MRRSRRQDTLHALKLGAIFGFLFGIYYVTFKMSLDAQHLVAGVTVLAGCMIGGMLLFSLVATLRRWFTG